MSGLKRNRVLYSNQNDIFTKAVTQTSNAVDKYLSVKDVVK